MAGMGIFSKHKQGMRPVERRQYHRRHSDGARGYLYAPGGKSQRCQVRDISRAGIFIETKISLPLALPVELAFTCRYTRQIMKIYRRSAYVARISEDGVVALYFDRRLAYP